MEIEWKENIQIQDGNHNGIITKIEYRDEPYEYTDVFIRLDEADVEIKYGCPTILSANSKLGRLLQVFGTTPQPKTKTNPETVLVNQKVKFMTITKKNKDGREYAEIVADSIKPNVSMVQPVQPAVVQPQNL